MGSHWGGGWTDVNSHRHPATRARGGAEQEKERGRCVRREGPSNWPVIPRRTSSSPAPERPRHLLPVFKRSDPLKPIKNEWIIWPRPTAHDCSVWKKTFFIISGQYSPARRSRFASDVLSAISGARAHHCRHVFWPLGTDSSRETPPFW